MTKILYGNNKTLITTHNNSVTTVVLYFWQRLCFIWQQQYRGALQSPLSNRSIELLHIECVLLYSISQKSVSTKWRIYKGKIWTPNTSPSTHSISTNSMNRSHAPARFIHKMGEQNFENHQII